MRQRGRPTTYTPDLAADVLDDLRAGIPLAETCRRLGISRTAVYQWRKANPEFDEQFAQAREIGFDQIAEETLEIADDGTNDWIQRQGKDGQVAGYELNGEHVQRSKIRIETRLKLLSKWDPARYGEKSTVEHTGNIALQVEGLGEHDLLAEIAQLVAQRIIPPETLQITAVESLPPDDGSDLV